MQLYTNITRENISIPLEQAKEWLKLPAGFVVHSFVNPFEIVQLHGSIIANRQDGGIYTALAALRRAKKTKEKPVKDMLRVTRSEEVFPEYGLCQVTGKYQPIKKLKWRRVYNKKLYCVEPKIAGLIWLGDKNQWVLAADPRLTKVFEYVGDTIKYATDEKWINKNVATVKSSIENRRIIKDESMAIRLPDGSNTRISKLERMAEEFNRYFHCSTCGNDCVWDMRVSDTLCSICAAAIAERNGQNQVFSYSHKVERDLGFDDADCIRINEIKNSVKQTGEPVFLGAELEFSVPDLQRDIITYINKSRYALCKSDSSVVNGFEIVTKPCSVATHKKNLAMLFEKYPTQLMPHDSCGLHVHVSRVFNNAEIGKVVHFLNREANRDFVVGIARRNGNTYAKFSDNALSSAMTKFNGTTLRRTGGSNKMLSSDRRTALNVKEHTLEFRMFAATNSYAEVIASIQFCEALFMYAHEVKSLPLNEWSDVKNFVDYIKRMVYKSTVVAGKPTVKEYRYQELIDYIHFRELSTVSKDMHSIKVSKVVSSFNSRLLTIPKRMDLPLSVKQDLAETLVKSGYLMAKWLAENSNIVTWHKDAWCLMDYKGNVMLRHSPATQAA